MKKRAVLEPIFYTLLVMAVGSTISVDSSQAADGTDDAVQGIDFEASPNTADSMLRQVVYTTGDRGGKLAWLPYRPDQVAHPIDRPDQVAHPTDRPDQVAHPIPSVQPVESTSLAPPAQLAPAHKPPVRLLPAQLTSKASGEVPIRPAVLTPMSDPFGDRPSVAQRPPSLTEPPNDRVLEGSTAGENPQSAIELPDDMEAPIDIEQRIAQSTQPPTVECQPASEVFEKSIHGIDPGIVPKVLDKDGNRTDKDLPPEDLPPDCPLGYEQPQRQDWHLHRSWAPTTFRWKASGLCHKPTYFEDVQLERYGHSWGPYLQPLASGAHFFLTVPVLPYKMGLYPPNECIYTLGYYRTGSCAPYLLDPIPLSARAALAQAGAVVGVVAFLP